MVRLAIAATRSSPWLSTAVPSALRASTSSPLARATSSMAPKASVWARATAVTTPMVGRAIVQRSRTWPTPRAPISITATSVSSAASSSVRGTPSSLLNERRLAAVARDGLVAAAIRSLTEVLPTEPVTAMTAMSPRRSRAWAPSAVRATRVSVTTTAGPSVVLSLDQCRRRSRGSRRVHEVMAIAVPLQGDEELPGSQGPAVHRGPVHDELGRADGPADGHPGHLVHGQVHAPVVP